MLSITKDRVKKIITHVILFLVLYLLQTTILTRIRLWDVCPLILPFAVIGVGLFENAVWGGVWGIVAGLFCDSSVGNSGLLFTVTLCVAGFLTGFFAEYYLARGFPTYFFLSVILLVLIACLQMFKHLVFDGVSFGVLAPVALYQTIYSSLFILPSYFPVRRVMRRIKT